MHVFKSIFWAVAAKISLNEVLKSRCFTSLRSHIYSQRLRSGWRIRTVSCRINQCLFAAWTWRRPVCSELKELKLHILRAPFFAENSSEKTPETSVRLRWQESYFLPRACVSFVIAHLALLHRFSGRRKSIPSLAPDEHVRESLGHRSSGLMQETVARSFTVCSCPLCPWLFHAR